MYLNFVVSKFDASLIQSEFNIWDLTAEPSPNTEWPEVFWLD